MPIPAGPDDDGPIWGTGLLVDPANLADELRSLDKQAVTPDDLAETALTYAQKASAYVRAYCTRGIPSPTPTIVLVIARDLAVRISKNPLSQRSVSAGEQSMDLPTAWLTYGETLLLSRWRRRAA